MHSSTEIMEEGEKTVEAGHQLTTPGNGPGSAVERERGGRRHARAVRRLDAPPRYCVAIQYRRAEADPARGRAARVLNPRAVPL